MIVACMRATHFIYPFNNLYFSARAYTQTNKQGKVHTTAENASSEPQLYEMQLPNNAQLFSLLAKESCQLFQPCNIYGGSLAGPSMAGQNLLRHQHCQHCNCSSNSSSQHRRVVSRSSPQCLLRTDNNHPITSSNYRA